MHAGQDGIEAFQRRNDGRILEIVARNRHAIDMEAYNTVLVVSDVLLVRSSLLPSVSVFLMVGISLCACSPCSFHSHI